MSKMNSRERVLAALHREEPDRVPYCEIGIDRSLAQRLMAMDAAGPLPTANIEANIYTVEEAKALARRLKTDNIACVLRAPVYARKEPGVDGRLFYGEGMIKTEKDLGLMELPDPHDDALYAKAEEFVKNRGDFACFFITRAGVFPAMLSMGIANFAISLYENPSFVQTVQDRYWEWSYAVAERVCQMGFDAYFTTDDLAFKSGPFFSPKMFREVVMPYYRKLAKKVSLPWIMHSDGNLGPIMEDLLSLGIAGLHPFEKGAMDIRAAKREFGSRICVLGNVDLNLLGIGTTQEVDEEVKGLIRDVAPGGGYIVTSGNSLASYVQPANALALSQAVQKYGRYPIRL